MDARRNGPLASVAPGNALPAPGAVAVRARGAAVAEPPGTSARNLQER